MSTVDDLFADPEKNLRRHFHLRYPPDKLETWKADLVRIVVRENEGAVMPSLSSVVRYARSAHGIKITLTTLKKQLEHIRNGEDPWPTTSTI